MQRLDWSEPRNTIVDHSQTHSNLLPFRNFEPQSTMGNHAHQTQHRKPNTMSKKLFSDAVFTSATAALHELQTRINTASEYFPGVDALAILATNIHDTAARDEQGATMTIPALGLDEASGAIVLTDPAAAGTLALITI